MKKIFVVLSFLFLSSVANAQISAQSELRLNDLPPGTSTDWFKVTYTDEYYFFVPPGASCQQQKSGTKDVSRCKFAQTSLTVYWCDYPSLTVDNKSPGYSIKQGKADGSLYTLESYETDTPDVYKFVGTIKDGNSTWATVSGQYAGAAKMNAVYEVFFQITKASNIGK